MAQYVHIGILLITVPNLIVIVLMLLVFALAVALPLPQWHTETADRTPNQPAQQHTEEGMIR